MFSACAPEAEPDVSAEEIVKEGIDNMAKVKSASYAIDLSGKFTNKDPYVEFKEMDIDAVRQAMMMDKKVVGGKIRWVLLNSIGDAVVVSTVSSQIVDRALRRLAE